MSLRNWLKKFVPMSSRSLNSRMDNVFTEISNLENQINKNFESTQACLKEDLLKQNKTTSKQIIGLSNKLDIIEKQEANLSGRLGLIEQQVTNLSGRFSQIEKQGINLSGRLDLIDRQISDLFRRMDLIDKQEALLSERLDLIDRQYLDLSNGMDIIKKQESDLHGRLDHIDKQGNNLVNKINIIDQRGTEIRNNSGKLPDIESKINTVIGNEDKLKTMMYYHLDPALYPHVLKQWYLDATGNILDLENPRTYNEKIQWMKLYDHDPLKILLADKYLVREWVKEKIGEDYIIPLLGVYHRADEIDFDTLPDSFVIKANHGSGMNIIVRNKSEVNPDELCRKANTWMHDNYTFHYGFELQYNEIPRRIIIEEYLENADGDMPDYKLWCFDGKCHFICYIKDRRNGPKMAFYDTEWNKLQFYYEFPQIQEDIERPASLQKMIELAEVLSAGFPHVRVDLYVLENDEIKFGEMTFSSASGTCHWNPPEADEWVGDLFHLPEKS